MKNAGINENGKALNTIKMLVKFKTLGENILKGDKMTGLIGLKTWKVLFLRKNTLIGKETSSSYFQTVWGFKDRYLKRNNFTFFFRDCLLSLGKRILWNCRTMIYELLTSIHGFSLNFTALKVESLKLLLSGYFLNCIKEYN